MKLAEVSRNGQVTSLHYNNKEYEVHYHNTWMWGSQYNLPTRKKAEEAFLWQVGYPMWKKTSDAAYKKASQAWLKTHTTLDSVEAEDFTP